MNRISAFLLLFFLLVFNFQLFSQQPNTKKILVNGVDYYEYTVQPGEGLYRISVKFHVTQGEINDLNPSVRNGLKSGQTIIIPIAKNNQVNNKNVPATSNNSTFKEIKVQREQTVFGISHEYGISQDELIKYNPEIKNGLKAGMIIRIPTNKNTQVTVKNTVASNVVKPVNSTVKDSVTTNNDSINRLRKSYFSFLFKKKNKLNTDSIKTGNKETNTHVVQPQETLYSISRQYNTTIDELIKLNPEAASKLEVGMTLQVPVELQNDSLKEITSATQIINMAKNADTTNWQQNEKYMPMKKKMSIAVLLPFMLNNNKADHNNYKFTDFYAGVILAIEQAKKMGVSFDIYTFDTEKSDDNIQQVLANNEVLKHVNLIIGPAYTNQITYVSDFAKKYKINTLIPFSSKVYDLYQNPYLYQFNPGNDLIIKQLADIFEDPTDSSNIIFCDIPSVNISDDGNELSLQLRNEFTQAGKSFQQVNLVNNRTIEKSPLFVQDSVNVVFFNTDKYSLIYPYLNSLTNVSMAKNVVLFEQYNWLNHNISDVKGFTVSPFLPDSVIQTKAYDKHFEKTFNWDPLQYKPRYDLLGYDMTRYFIKEYLTTDSLGMYPVLQPSSGIQSGFNFMRNNSTSGFVNTQLYITKTNN